MAMKRVDTSKFVTNKKYKMIIREIVIYGDNKKSIELTKSFERLA